MKQRYNFFYVLFLPLVLGVEQYVVCGDNRSLTSSSSSSSSCSEHGSLVAILAKRRPGFGKSPEKIASKRIDQQLETDSSNRSFSRLSRSPSPTLSRSSSVGMLCVEGDESYREEISHNRDGTIPAILAYYVGANPDFGNCFETYDNCSYDDRPDYFLKEEKPQKKNKKNRLQRFYIPSFAELQKRKRTNE